MPILERIRRIARANITQFLNQVEQPEEEIGNKIRELEQAANEAKDALAGFAVTYKRLEKNVVAQREKVSHLQQSAEAALRAGEESQARRALAERIKVEERLHSLETVLVSRRATYDELKEDLVEIHDQLNQARSRLVDLKSRKRAAEAEEAMGRQLDELGKTRDASFERFEEDVLEAEARSEIEREIRGDLKPLHERLASQAEQEKLDKALDALRKSIDQGAAS